MKKVISIIALFFLLSGADTFGQNTINKQLFFYQDSIIYVGCGNITYATVLLFVADTSRKNKASTLYNIVVECPELYGKDFFNRGAEYNLVLSKDFKKIRSYFSKDFFLKLRKRKNLYLCENINLNNK